MKAKTKVDISYKRLDDSEGNEVPDIVKEKIAEAKVVRAEKTRALVVSRADFPTKVFYGNDVIRLSPRAKVEVLDESLIDRKKLDNLVSVIVKK